MVAKKRGSVPSTAIPPVARSPYNWPTIAAKLERSPGTWVMVPDISSGLFAKIRAGQNRWLSALGGTLQAHQRNTRLVVGERGTSRRGELWLCWTPEEER